jgi:hypothetical protein
MKSSSLAIKISANYSNHMLAINQKYSPAVNANPSSVYHATTTKKGKTSHAGQAFLLG